MDYRIILYYRMLFEKVDDICAQIEKQFDVYLNWRASKEGKFIFMLCEKEFPWEDVPYIFILWRERPIPHIVPNPSESPEKQESADFFMREDIEAAEVFIEAVNGQKIVRPYVVERWFSKNTTALPAVRD